MAAAIPAALYVVGSLLKAYPVWATTFKVAAFASSFLIAGRSSKVRGEDTARSDNNSQTYSFGGLALEAADSIPIPVIYGTHRVSGNILWQYIGTDQDADYRYTPATDVLYTNGPTPWTSQTYLDSFTESISTSDTSGIRITLNIPKYFPVTTTAWSTQTGVLTRGSRIQLTYNIRITVKDSNQNIIGSADTSLSRTAIAIQSYGPLSIPDGDPTVDIFFDDVYSAFTVEYAVTVTSNSTLVDTSNVTRATIQALHKSLVVTEATRKLFLLLGIGEGLLTSIEDVRLNDQPLSTLLGANVAYSETRLGTSSNSPTLPISPSIRNSVTQSVEQDVTVGAKEYIIEGNVEAAKLRFIFPTGCFSVYVIRTYKHSDGTKQYTGFIQANSVQLKVEYSKVTEDNWTTAIDQTLSFTHGGISPSAINHANGPTDFSTSNASTPLEVPLTLKFPEAGRYKIRYQRLDEPVEFSGTYPAVVSGTNQMTLDSMDLRVSNVIDTTLTYPRTALLYLSVIPSDSLSGSLPNVTMTVKGLQITNPITSITEYSDNPAWCLYDLLCNSRYGLGNYISADDIDLDSFESAATYYDGLIDDGVGGSSKRFTVNIVLDSNDSALGAIQKILLASRSFFVWSGGQLKLRPDKEEAAVQVFTEDTISADSLTYEYSSRNELFNSIRVSYYPWYLENRKTTLRAQTLEASVGSSIIREHSLDLMGVTNYSQAIRLAKYFLESAQRQRIKCAFKTGSQGIVAEPGDVIAITHSTPIGWDQKLFRIIDISETSNYECSIQCVEYDAQIYINADVVPGNVNEITERQIPNTATVPPGAVTDLTLGVEYTF